MAHLARYDDLNTRAIAYGAFVSCVILLVIILLLRALTCAWVNGGEQQRMAEARYYTSDDLISEQKARLIGYDKQKVEFVPSGDDKSARPETTERIYIPVDRAGELILESANSAGDKPAGKA